ncbi:MAG: methylmalonyl Co-A mutase-associated GTPase MeaB [Burkholderiaceae bacterium]|nr:methylmalonyl Co-A mutase-associated GTPase MeaB [Burkholderiaceae bacterium]
MGGHDTHELPLVARALAGDRRALARLLTHFDDDAKDARRAAAEVAARAGRALVVGITGVPGSGKSTLVNVLLGQWLARGRRIAVVAIDPSSPITGGAVLGDRIRMGEHGVHPDVFIRSLSARAELGGLSRATRAAVDCLDAAGFDRVIVETVGTGQSETAIAALADTRVVVCPPGLGDDVQAIKAGVLEIADLLAISKGDLPLAQETRREMREMLALRRPLAEGAWKTPVLVVSATTGEGVAALVDAIEAHAAQHGCGRRLRRAGPILPAASPAAVIAAAPADAVADAAATAAAVDTVVASAASAVPDAAVAAVALRDTAPAPDAPADPADTQAWRARLAALLARDGLCAALGFTLVDAGPGRAEVQMRVDARHLNFNGGCHGGALFALADTAFGLASNSHGPLASGIDVHMTFQVGVRAGDRLVARASEIRRSRRIGVYRVDVACVRADGEEQLVSCFTGTVSIR